MNSTMNMSLKIFLVFQLVISTLAFSISGFTANSPVHCSIRREISPCTCAHVEYSPNVIRVTCEKIESFATVVKALQGKFDPDVQIQLKIAYSKLKDFNELNFKQLGLSITSLHLNNNNLSEFSEDVFAGLHRVEHLSLIENGITEIPHHIFRHMPSIKNLDLSGNFIQNVTSYDFKSLPSLQTLVLRNNNLTSIEKGSLPPTIKYLTIDKNNISNLNEALSGLKELNWLFMAENMIQSLEGEFADYPSKLTWMKASHNSLERLPNFFKFAPLLSMITFENNRIRNLNGSFGQCRNLHQIFLSNNLIEYLSPNDFAEQKQLDELQIGHNKITALNNSLIPLRLLRYLNLTHNKLVEFSLQDIRGLKMLRIVDLSHNKITQLGGKMENLVELETRIFELKLEHNELETLDGSLSGIQGLNRLNLSHNKLTRIATGGLMGLEDLKMLDISHNMLTSLEETAKTFLPSLEELIAHNNALTLLERDFHGLPVLCWADLGHNQIHTVHLELIEKTQCKVYGVNSTLKIYLHGNPVLCNEEMKRVFSAMETKNKSKIHGFETADCSTIKPSPATTSTTPALETTSSRERPTVTASVITPVTSVPHLILSYTETIRPQFNDIEEPTTESLGVEQRSGDGVTSGAEASTMQPVSSTITYEVVQPVVVIAAPLEQMVNTVNSAELNQTGIMGPVSITVS